MQHDAVIAVWLHGLEDLRQFLLAAVATIPCLQNWFVLEQEESMSILGKIMGAIFGGSSQAAPAASGANPSSAAPQPKSADSAAPSLAPAAPGPVQTGSGAGGGVDVAPILDKAVAGQSEKLDWRQSIVDLMKALNIDSSLTARKELAKELGFTGDGSDSATMNIWLHKQVMQKLKDNGGKLPAEIKH